MIRSKPVTSVSVSDSKSISCIRSLTFWAGIMVMTFLCWGWRDSMSKMSRVTSGNWTIFSYGGGLMLHRNMMSMPSEAFRDDVQNPLHKTTYPWLGGAPFFVRGGGEDFPWDSHEAFMAFYIEPMNAAETLREAELIHMRFATSWEWCVFAPYWLILSTFALVWSACLTWRGRRRKRAVQVEASDAFSECND